MISFLSILISIPRALTTHYGTRVLQQSTTIAHSIIWHEHYTFLGHLRDSKAAARPPSQWCVSCVVVCAFLLLTHLTVPISFHLSISACSLDPPSPFPPVGASDPHFESPPPFESSPCMIHHPYTHYFGSNAHGQPHREKRIVPSLIRGRGSL